MEARQINLLSFISGSDKRLIIPVFQRNYDWKISQCEQIFEDILKLINNTKTHFIGSIVYISNSEVDMVDLREYVIIDGQQRITTIFLLLKAIYDIAGNVNSEEASGQLKDKIYEYYLINKFQDEKNKLRLKPMKEDDVIFKKIMKGNLEGIDKNSNIFKNYKYFENRLSKTNFSLKQIFEATQKLMMVYISLKRGEDDPQLIFESINSTGVSLTQGDLIRNFILMDKEPNEQEFLFEKYWYAIENNLSNELISDFIRDYLTMKNEEIPKKSDVYLEFKKFVNDEKESIEVILTQLKYFSGLYRKIIYSKTENDILNKLLQNLNRLKITVSYPFLLEVLDKYEREAISTEEIVEILKIIISYVFRRLICELPSNALNKIFKKLNKEIIGISKSNKSYSEKLAIILLKKKYSSSFPSDKEFKMNFMSKNIYAFKHRNYLLEELENFNNKEIVNINNLTIEHIMPQTLTNQWKAKLGRKYDDIHEMYLHKIGNLTLSAYNGNMSNKTFNEKKEILKDSKLQLNKLVLEYNSWTDKEIVARAEKLAEVSLNIWKFPDVIIEDEKYNLIENKEYFTFDDEINVTGLKPYSIEIIGAKFTIKNWREFFTKIMEVLFELDSEKILQLIDDDDFYSKSTKIISSDEKGCRKPYKINEKVYLEVNLSANSILNYAKLFFEKLGLDYTDIKFWIR